MGRRAPTTWRSEFPLEGKCKRATAGPVGGPPASGLTHFRSFLGSRCKRPWNLPSTFDGSFHQLPWKLPLLLYGIFHHFHGSLLYIYVEASTTTMEASTTYLYGSFHHFHHFHGSFQYEWKLPPFSPLKILYGSFPCFFCGNFYHLHVSFHYINTSTIHLRHATKRPDDMTIRIPARGKM